MTCETNCYPLIANVLSLGLYAAIGAFAVYCTVAILGIAAMAGLTVIAWLHHLVFRPDR